MTIGMILFAITMLILAGDGFFKIKTAWEFCKGGWFNPLPDKGEARLPNGCTLYWEPNGAGGRTYISDEIGGGVLVWDTCLCNESTLRAALRIEASLSKQERA